MPEVYSVATLANHWGCHPDTIYALIRGGELRAFKLGGKLLRIRGDEVERFERQPTRQAEPDEISDRDSLRLERLVSR